MHMDSSPNTTCLLVNEQERRSEIRKRNRNLVLIIFSIFISVALVTGGVTSYLLRVQYLHKQQSYVQDLAIRHFCSAARSNNLEISGYDSCITILFHTVHKTTLFANHPNKIFKLLLEKSYNGLSDIITTRHETCMGSLSHALSHVNSSLRIIPVNSDLQWLSYEEMRSVKVGMKTALDELGSCVNGTRKDGLKGEDEVNLKVYDVMVWMRYGNDFLLRCNRINTIFRLSLENDGGSGRIVGNFLQVSLFGSQYLVLVLLFLMFFTK